MTWPRKLLDWQRQAIVDAYRAGEKIDAIAAEFKVSRPYPGLLAKEAGVRLRRGKCKASGNPGVASVNSAAQ